MKRHCKATWRFGILALLAATLAAAPLSAGTIPGRWEKIDALPAGTGLDLRMKSGQRIGGFLERSDAESLRLTDPVTGAREIRKAEVEQIRTQSDVPDMLADGVAKGALIGLGMGLLVASQADDSTGGKAAGVGLNLGLGALIGYLADRSHTGPEVLYRSK